MAPLKQFSQFDLTKAYTYADYLTWKFDEFIELIKGNAADGGADSVKLSAG